MLPKLVPTLLILCTLLFFLVACQQDTSPAQEIKVNTSAQNTTPLPEPQPQQENTTTLGDSQGNVFYSW